MKKGLKKFLINKLAKWAKRVVDNNNSYVIGITGSIAKTTAKEAIYCVLEKKFGQDVEKSEGNLNSEWGLPLVILRFKVAPKRWQWPLVLFKGWHRSRQNIKLPRYLVLEMASDKPGDIKHLLSIVPVKMAVVTSAGQSHLAQFGDIGAVAKEKGELVRSLDNDGVAILNEADSYVAKMARLTNAQIIYFQGEGANIAEEAARAVGRYFKIEDSKIDKALKDKVELEGRLRLIDGPRGSLILNDCYNANPTSMKVALDELERLAIEKRKSRKIAILGDMLDLGKQATIYHAKVIWAAKEKADLIVGVGPFMKMNNPDYSFNNSGKAGKWLLKEIQEGDIVLIKGSHGMHLEKIINYFQKTR